MKVTQSMDYLRQSFRCAGDNAFEGISETWEGRKTDGWGNSHVCKKKDEYIQWVYDNRWSNFTGIH